jgi:hypothetical protein
VSGSWGEVWDSAVATSDGADRRKAVKAANDAPAAEGDADMFAQAGVAAE